MYLQNKYTRYYYSIVDRAKARKTIGYAERHHIIPKSIGGLNTKENLVKLTAREHFICHWLLTKMLPEGINRWKLMYAFNSFNRANKNQNRYIPTAKQYEIMKRSASEARSKLNAGNTYAKGYKRSQETIEMWRETRAGFRHADSSKKKQSNSMKERYKNQDYVHSGKSYEEIYGKEEAEKRKAKLKGPRGPRKNKQPLVSCVRCHRSGSLAGMNRYHLVNNCNTTRS